MRPAQSSKTAAIPVELIVEAGSSSDTPSSSQQQSADSSEASTDSLDRSAEETVSPADSQADRQVAQADEQTETTTENVQTSSAEPANRSVEQSTAEQSTAESRPSVDPADSEVADSNSSDLNSQDSDSQTLADSTGSNDEDTLPILSGDRTIPDPGSESAGSDSPQTVYLKVVGHDQVPRSLLKDIATTPPQPIYEDITAVELRPQDVSCPRVGFSQSQVTYRITVNRDGSMQNAIPWTGSIAERPPLNEEESAIACLLLASGFRFTPATSEGDPVVSDNLLLTIDLIESQSN